MIPFTVHAGVVGVIEWVHDPVFNQRSDDVFAEFLAEGFGVVAAISSEAPQVVGVAPSDLRADLRIVFLGGRRVDVGDVQRFDIHESRDFQRSNAVFHAVGVLATGLITVKASRIDSSVAGAFLGVLPEKRTPPLGRNPLKPRAKHRVVRKSIRL